MRSSPFSKIWRSVRAPGAEEYRELQEFAARELAIADLQVWDVPYASEKLRLARYALSQEELRPYFPAAESDRRFICHRRKIIRCAFRGG